MAGASIPLTSFATFGELLKFLRRRAQLSQLELSVAVGYSESQISRLESNQRPPDRASLLALFAPALGIADEPETVARLLKLADSARDAPASPLAPGAPVAPPATPDQSPRGRLPLQLTSFIGRQEELAELCDLLRDGPPARLVTLTGAGGVGKTRLALRVGEALAEAYAHGVWLVELAGLSDPSLLPKAVAATFDLRERADQPLPAALTDFLHPRCALLILDNCEHLVEAVAPLVEALLRACPRLQILATSRETLGVPGETAFPVQPLALPPGRRDAVLPAAALAGYAAIELFVTRARAGQRTFALTDRNAAAVTRICQRLDGIPLGIELAAGWANLLRPEEIAERLEDNFSLLTGRHRIVLPRHRTLAAAIEWSYNLLTETERLLLRRLSVFVGGWTLAAAEAIGPCPADCPTPLTAQEVLHLLGRLVSKSLVTFEPAAEGETRYRLLVPIRDYLQEKLAVAGETERLQDRRLAYYVALAEAAEPELKSDRQIAWLSRLDAERDNLRAAFEWAVARQNALAGLRLAAALWRFWWIRYSLAEGSRWCAAVLALADEDLALRRSPVRGKALLTSGLLAVLRFDGELAQRHLEESLRIAQEHDDAEAGGAALGLLGANQDGLGNLEEAVRCYQAGLALSQRAEDAWWIAETLH